jgi:hypothetical protein
MVNFDHAWSWPFAYRLRLLPFGFPAVHLLFRDGERLAGGVVEALGQNILFWINRKCLLTHYQLMSEVWFFRFFNVHIILNSLMLF